MRRIIMDELPAPVELMLWDRAHGKTVEKMEFKDVTDPIEELTLEQLEDRAVKLLEVARRLRAGKQEGSDEVVGRLIH